MAPSTMTEADPLRAFIAEESGLELTPDVAEESKGLSGRRKLYTRPNGVRHIGRPIAANNADADNDVELLRALRQAQIFPRLLSVPGTGKTSSLEAAFGEELITVVCSEGLEEGELTGRYRQDPETKSWTEVYGALATAMQEGRPIVLDEIAAAHPRVMSRINGVFDGRLELVLHELRDQRITAAPGFWAAIAYNPGPDFEISDALASRFGFAVRYTTDYFAAELLGVPKEAIELAKDLQRRVDAGEGEWAPQMRELVKFKEVNEALGQSFAIGALINAAPEECAEEVLGAARDLLPSAEPLVF